MATNLKEKSILVITKGDIDFKRDSLLIKAIKYLGMNLRLFNKSKPFLLRQFALVSYFFKNHRKFDYVLLTSRSKLDILTVKKLCILFGKPLIVDVFMSTYNTLVEDRGKYKKGTIAAWLMRLFDKIVVSLANASLLDTNEHINYFKRTIKKNGRYYKVLMGANIKESILSKKVKKKDKKFNVLYFGTYIPLHGVKYILQAASKIKGPDVKFTLIGRGQTYPEMISFAKKLNLKNVEFKEFLQERFNSDIESSDVCLGIFGDVQKAKMVVPTKMYKAMSMHKCVITGKSKAMNEFFVEGKDYVGVNFADSEDLKEKILRLKNNRTLLEQIADNGFSTFCKKCDIPSIAKELSEVLVKV